MSLDTPQPSREELEARLTALLLGELSAEDAAVLQRAIQQDPELARLRQRLKQTVGLVREAAASPIEPATAQAAPLKLSNERRQKLLAQFKTVGPKEFTRPSRRKTPWFVPMSAAAALMALIGLALFWAGTEPKRRIQHLTPLSAIPSKVVNAAMGGEADSKLPPILAYEPRQTDSKKLAQSTDAERALVRQRGFDDNFSYYTDLARQKALGVEDAEGNKPTSSAKPPSLPQNYSIILPSGGGSADKPPATMATNASWFDSNNELAGKQLGGEGKASDLALGIESPNRTGLSPSSSLRDTSVRPGDGSELGRPTPGRGARDRMQISGKPSQEMGQFGELLLERQKALSDQSKTNSTTFSIPGRSAGEPSQETVVTNGVLPPAPSPSPMPVDEPLRQDPHVGIEQLVRKGEDPRAINLGELPAVGGLFRFESKSSDLTGKDVGDLQQLGPTPKNELAAIGLERGLSQSEEKRTQAPNSNIFSANAVGYVNVTVLPTNLVTIADEETVRRKTSSKSSRPVITVGSVEPNLANRGDGEPADAQSIDTAEKSGAYEQKKRDLDNLALERERLSLRLIQEKVDAAIPKSGFVRIVDRAEAQPDSTPTLGERIKGAFTGGIERSARIAVEKNAGVVPGLDFDQRAPSGFDPYWTQTEFETLQSKPVLEKVIEKLNLNEAWAKERGSGEKLKTEETVQLLKKRLNISQARNSNLIDIRVKSEKPDEAARIANTIAEVYRDYQLEHHKQVAAGGINVLEDELGKQEKKLASAREELEDLQSETESQQTDVTPPKPAVPPPIPQPEVQTRDNAFLTFSLNVSDVSFKLAAASLEKGVMPEPATVRSEEFINAFDYRDPEPPPGVPIDFAWERARYPFAHNRDLLRFSVKTAAAGRQPGRPLNLVLLLDNSGSMERADRVLIIREALRVLATQLQPQDKISVVIFARTARLWADGVPGNQAGQVAEQVSDLTPQGGTNLEDALNLAYQTALRHYLANGVNRVVLLTDGAANLGNVSPDALKLKVEAHRKQGIALDCFGVGWEGFNDDLLEVLSRNGDGRYGFINLPEDAATEFAGQLAGALKVAASDVKVQVEFNPARVTAYRQIGYAKHQLTKEQFRDNTVDAAEIGAAESGNALYVAEVNPRGEGSLATVRVRFKVPGTGDYREHEWAVPYTGNAVSLEQASPAMRLAATASAFSEWLVSSPYAAEVTPDQLLGYLSGVPDVYGADARPKKLEWMVRQAKSVAGK